MKYLKVPLPDLKFAKKALPHLLKSFVPIIVIAGSAFLVTISIYKYQAKSSLRNTLHYIESDKAYLMEQGDQIANDPILASHIQNADQIQTLDYLTRQRDARNIGLMGVTDANGAILTRTKTVSRRGDNVLLTLPIGRAISTSKHVSSIEVSGIDPTQIIITTARHVKQDGVRVGTLFANYLADEVYSERLKKKVLAENDHVIFYTHTYGVYSSTLQDEVKHIVSTHFSPGSVWINDKATNRLININGKIYWVQNEQFKGLESSPGGVAVLVSLSPMVPILATLIIAAVYYLILIKYGVLAKSNRRTIVSIIGHTIISLFLIALVLLVSSLRIQKTPYVIYNSTMRIQPESGVFTHSGKVTSSVRLDSGGEAINSIRLSLSFDPKILSVSEIVTADSICKLFPHNSYDNIAGTATLECGMPFPGFTGTSGIVADIVFNTVSPGSAAVKFLEQTQVLANDGLGTNVLRNTTNAQYIIAESRDLSLNNTGLSSPHLAGQQVENGATTNENLIVYSPSHPNTERWYNQKNVVFTWDNRSNSEVEYAIDSNSSTEPSGSQTTTSNRLEYPAPADGIYYFHARFKNSPNSNHTTHYPVRIDTASPSPVDIRISDSKPRAGQVVRLEFSAGDNLSGTQSNYYLKVNDGLFLPTGKQTYIPFSLPGKQTITLRAYDNANNISDTEMTFFVYDRLGIIDMISSLWQKTLLFF